MRGNETQYAMRWNKLVIALFSIPMRGNESGLPSNTGPQGPGFRSP